MNANALLITQIAASPLATGKSALTGANGIPQGFDGFSGLNFIDLIFAQTKPAVIAPESSTPGTSIVLTQRPAISSETESDVLASLLLQLDTDTSDILNAGVISAPRPSPLESPEIIDPKESALTQNGKPASESPAGHNNPFPFAGLGSLRSYLDSLLQGLPQEQKIGQTVSGSAEIKAGSKQFMDSFRDNLVITDKTEGDATLIATGLSPEDISVLVESIDATAADKSLPAVTLVTPPSTAEQLATLLPRTLIAIQELSQKTKEAPITEPEVTAESETAAALNALVVGEVSTLHNKKAPDAVPSTPSAQTPAGSAPAYNQALIDTTSQLPGGVSADHEHAMGKGLENALEHIDENMEKIDSDGKKMPAGLQNTADKLQQKIGAGLSTITQPAGGSIETAADWHDVFPEGMDPSNPYGTPLKTGTVASTTTLTSLVNHAPHASNPHPATQSVAATISKLASNGDDKAFTIKLDPPELGRVEIKMMIDKNNAVKAHLIIEKPETYMMLQRDAQILERSLQGIGLDAGDGGLSFELAQDGNMFRNEGEGGGERYQSGANAGSESEDSAGAVMETTMTWHVDPDTGMQRYDILV
ncbi:MAG: flagellar hook-length control protein FliK [Micavibrio aeruginosavorus]|uniref:Flagellar hook-length control protein FliK n=1 Tax=Micavibrio aeruginosavorus TaxID=349221 RepID=A0A7T5R1Q5_9BACT|nr:MAG: flagellar hook-length control protein FliK [Micavibrio aeruginosavorus]